MHSSGRAIGVLVGFAALQLSCATDAPAPDERPLIQSISAPVELPVYLGGSDAPADSPAGMIAGLLAPIPVRRAPVTEVEAVSLVVEASADDTLVTTVALIAAPTQFTNEEYSRELAAVPLFPTDLSAIPRPDNGSYTPWTQVDSLDDHDSSSNLTTATIGLVTTNPAVENTYGALPATALADPIRNLIDQRDLGPASRSAFVWGVGHREIGARVWFEGITETRLDIARWIGESAWAGSDWIDDQAMGASLSSSAGPGGAGTVAVKWQPADGLLELSFEYAVAYRSDSGWVSAVAPDAGSDRSSSLVVRSLIDWGADWYVASSTAPDLADNIWRQLRGESPGWELLATPVTKGESDEQPGSVIDTAPGTVTTRLRHQFEVLAPERVGNFYADAFVDDGIVIWLNGVEAYRWNMPDGSVDSETLAVEGIYDLFELTMHRQIPLPTNHLQQGTNVIAVEVHQATADSSDVRFDFRLTSVDTLLND